MKTPALLFVPAVLLLAGRDARSARPLPPVHRAAVPDNVGRQNMLFAPCPLTPRNLPRFDERKA